MKNKVEILKPPTIKIVEHKDFKTEDKILKELVDSFTKILEDTLPKEKLYLFRNNISTLKIEYKNMIHGLLSNMFNRNTKAQYFLDENKIAMLPLNKKFLGYSVDYNTEDFIEDLYHELLHVSSTILDKKRNIAFSGFSQIGNSMPIGIALDDGYTELLLYRLFNVNKEYLTYKYEIIMSSLIEQIIEKEKMKKLYFNANLYGLTKELQKYNTKENIIKFIEDLDSIYVLEEHKKYRKDIIYYHNEITEFIVETYLNKLKKEIEIGTITKAEYNMKLDKCLKDLHIAFDMLEVSQNKSRKRNI